ncbi:MAG: type VI secretion system-associated protein TagO [Yoonia sp.]
MFTAVILTVSSFWAAASNAQGDIPECGEATIGVQCVAMQEVVGPWQIEEVVPPVGTQNAIKMTTDSFEAVPGIFGREQPANFVITCVENTTSAEVRFGENFMSDVGDYARMIYKLDDRPPVAVTLVASDDNRALGLYTGVPAIGFIRNLFEADRLLVSAETFTGRNLTSSFSIDGIETAILPLRQLCNW